MAESTIPKSLASEVNDTPSIKFGVTSITFKPTKQLNSSDGMTFNNFRGSNLTINVPDGYRLLRNMYIEISGSPGIICIYDGIYKTEHTTINPYVYNASQYNISTSISLTVMVVSAFEKIR